MEITTHNPYLNRIRQHLNEGNLWRAKEILQSNIRSHAFNPQLYEAYGQVLLMMGDTIEAGKYLFLSGETQSTYKPAIDLYLYRHAKKDWKSQYGTFPHQAKLAQLMDYPVQVQDVLRGIGCSDRIEREIAQASYASPVVTWRRKAVVLIGLAVVVLILICALAGAGVIIRGLVTMFD